MYCSENLILHISRDIVWNYGLGIRIPESGITESDWMNMFFATYCLLQSKQLHLFALVLP